MNMKKQIEEPLYDSLCAYCEHANEINEDEGTVYCEKKKRTMPLDGHCLSFFYDLLKREPKMPVLPEVELPVL